MSALLIVYLLIFALFGMASTELLRFIYFSWVKKELRLELIRRVMGYVVVIVLLSTLGPWLLS
ncbi:hypothetical protein ACFOEE_18755 [Pseudoalteromonas fenneropenaei]|uniref:Uncharacterized protein n=1 Tax=Pseudoalteromonas fenneropenaei TaxID=1737459 RepID=A0ABV7CPJ8_9GAMM